MGSGVWILTELTKLNITYHAMVKISKISWFWYVDSNKPKCGPKLNVGCNGGKIK